MSPTRRRFLATAGATAAAATAGCAALPPGPTDGVTAWRRSRLSIPDTPRPAEPSDTQVLALRTHLDSLVTRAEPLYRRVDVDALPDGYDLEIRAGVPAVRDFLAESADDPASMDYNFARSRVSYAATALGFLRSWFDLDDRANARERAVAARDSLAAASAETPRDAVEPTHYLARVGWAEREFLFAWYAVDQYDDSGGEPSDDLSRAERAERVGDHYEHAEKSRMHATAGRYYIRDYRRGRSGDATSIVDALDGRRDDVLAAVADSLPPLDRADALAENRTPPVSTYYRRLDNPLGHAQRERRLGARAADHGWHALGAIGAVRARAHLAGYERARKHADPASLREGVPPATLFESKRRVVRRVRALAGGGDPLLAWLVREPARLLSAGEVYLEPDSVMDTRERARAVCLAFYRHAAGYVDALPAAAHTVSGG